MADHDGDRGRPAAPVGRASPDGRLRRPATSSTASCPRGGSSSAAGLGAQAARGQGRGEVFRRSTPCGGSPSSRARVTRSPSSVATARASRRCCAPSRACCPPRPGTVYTSGKPSLLGVNAALMRDLSGERNILLGCMAMGMTREQAVARRDWIARVRRPRRVPQHAHERLLLRHGRPAAVRDRGVDQPRDPDDRRGPGHRRCRVPAPQREADHGAARGRGDGVPGLALAGTWSDDLQPGDLAGEGPDRHGRRGQRGRGRLRGDVRPGAGGPGAQAPAGQEAPRAPGRRGGRAEGGRGGSRPARGRGGCGGRVGRPHRAGRSHRHRSTPPPVPTATDAPAPAGTEPEGEPTDAERPA